MIIILYYNDIIGAKGGKGAAAPKRDRFARACTGVGAGGVRSVRVSVCHGRPGAAGRGNRKHPKIPSNRRRRIQLNFLKFCILENTSRKPYINVTVSYMFFGARKSRENRIKSTPSCSIGINSFRRVTRYSRKWAPEVPKTYTIM